MRPPCRPLLVAQSCLAPSIFLAPMRRIHLTSSLQRPHDPTPSKDDDDYYSLLLSSPLPSSFPSASQPKPASPLSNTLAKEQEQEAKQPGPQVVFGSRLAGPAQARERPEWATQKPQEPDNCCMSGCVHCVWDLYREEMEEWVGKQKRQEKKALGAGKSIGSKSDPIADAKDGGAVGDLDGMGSGFDSVDVSQEGLFEGLPIGIRQFMKTEKRLRESRERNA